MNNKLFAGITVCLLAWALRPAAAQAVLPDEAELSKMSARFAPVDMRVDLKGLSAGDKKALVKLIEVSRVLNKLYLRQIWDGNLKMYETLKADTTPLGRARLSYFWLNKSPWSSIDGHKVFTPGAPERKPLGANFYPGDMTKEEFEKWYSAQNPGVQEAARGFFSVIRRDTTGKLTVVPYSREYATELAEMAGLLRAAAADTTSATLKKFLSLRADALLSNDYIASDIAWLELDSPIELTFGPYETYNDEFFGYKAAFESYVTLRDAKESRRFAVISKYAQELENSLPIQEQYRRKDVGATDPIKIVNVIFNAGDASRGVQSAAFNLPNDEKVTSVKGSKQTMLKNIQQAKFEKVLKPIAALTLAPKELSQVSFDAFFSHILMHEVSHALGPHNITVDGRATTVREALKGFYGALEEAKADALGLFSLRYLIDNASRLGIRNIVGGDAERRSLYSTFLASSFRTLRFGAHEAHGKGMIIQLNYLMDKKAIVVKNGSFSVDEKLIGQAVRELVKELLMLEATGDYAGVAKLMAGAETLRPELETALKKLGGIPVDISPSFITAQEIAGK